MAATLRSAWRWLNKQPGFLATIIAGVVVGILVLVLAGMFHLGEQAAEGGGDDDGTVVAPTETSRPTSAPRDGSPSSPATVGTASEASLLELETSGTRVWLGLSDVSIEAVTHSTGLVSPEIGPCYRQSVSSQDFLVRGDYQTLSADFGVWADRSEPGVSLRLSVVGDGRELWYADVEVGHHKVATVDVEGVARLKVIATRNGGGTVANCDKVRAALGDPHVS